ncbi:DeoR/GlpR family DNA-binding transcription regulator [Sporolactobacillus sp. CPB3-1]|uniref:Lactose phosphotransferase system repressor n=1 Tax=Sporolactobacillus mangiferae TaxID=2940498 RepID=A0ABT0MD33_9BACL|nr:DeoR/GlpR family DNA-binding transcription regulator [Sporolactobacillus mangiferae]MCL1632776.1 DeoR/GlpR family DNA-binding transcription regulator [Sporolactobacillus mangiferae]
MLKEERYQAILRDLEINDVASVSDLAKKLDVTEMTIRRDLSDLEERNLIDRIHGGARKKGAVSYHELSHIQKREINVEKKKYIARRSAELIEDKDVVFIGPGTTAGFIHDYLNKDQFKHLDIVTNSVSVFEQFKNDAPRFELILVGGRYRARTETFVGYFTNKMLQEFNVTKAFIGTNGISELNVTTANEDEGIAQKIILDHAAETYILADSTKFGVEAFHNLYDVRKLTAIVTDPSIDDRFVHYYSDKVKLIK